MSDWRKIIKDTLKQRGLRHEDLVPVLDVKDRSSVTNMLNGTSGISWEKMLDVTEFLKLDLNLVAGRSNSIAEPSATYTAQPNSYPLLSWADITDLPQALSTKATKQYACPVKCSSRTYVLPIISPEMAPDFPLNHLIWVDPKRKPKLNDTVIVQASPQAPALHRLYQPLSTGEAFTSITNPDLKHQLDTTRLEDGHIIHGTVIFCGSQP